MLEPDDIRRIGGVFGRAAAGGGCGWEIFGGGRVGGSTVIFSTSCPGDGDADEMTARVNKLRDRH